jgi:hypothetical protein
MPVAISATREPRSPDNILMIWGLTFALDSGLNSRKKEFLFSRNKATDVVENK